MANCDLHSTEHMTGLRRCCLVLLASMAAAQTVMNITTPIVTTLAPTTVPAPTTAEPTKAPVTTTPEPTTETPLPTTTTPAPTTVTPEPTTETVVPTVTVAPTTRTPKPTTKAPVTTQPVVSSSSSSSSSETQPPTQTVKSKVPETSDSNNLYLYIGIGAGGVVLVVVIVFLAMKLRDRDDDDEDYNPSPQSYGKSSGRATEKTQNYNQAYIAGATKGSSYGYSSKQSSYTTGQYSSNAMPTPGYGNNVTPGYGGNSSYAGAAPAYANQSSFGPTGANRSFGGTAVPMSRYAQQQDAYDTTNYSTHQYYPQTMQTSPGPHHAPPAPAYRYEEPSFTDSAYEFKDSIDSRDSQMSEDFVHSPRNRKSSVEL
ncbi:hypothetical protein ACHHYP_01248 [Achlya hypogyna]|uniref:Secreted protein n=1 Tax=Achlya hypogyna TaxID=1202772 RepID=A0A1V9Z969_ACHHY|nr:hypothetical protein ACHHYP_01248 [Achlya hypogyna]